MSLKEQENKLDKKLNETENEVKVYQFRKEFPIYQAMTVVVVEDHIHKGYKVLVELISQIIGSKEVITSVDIAEELPMHYEASGIAFCHHKENSCNKTLGRVIAKGRLLKSLDISRQ